MGALFAKKFIGARNLIGRLGSWIGTRLVQDVPGDIAACEFDCSKPKCEGTDLTNCERRKRSEQAESCAGARRDLARNDLGPDDLVDRVGAASSTR